MAFPLAAGAFGSQPFGQAMEGLNKAKAPQPLNYEEWKADTGQAGASGYQNYTQGFTPTPAPPSPVQSPQSPPDQGMGMRGGGGWGGSQVQSPQPPPPQQQSPMQAAQGMGGWAGKAAQAFSPQQPPQPPPNVDMEALIKMLMSSGLGQQVGNTQMFQNLLGRFRQ